VGRLLVESMKVKGFVVSQPGDGDNRSKPCRQTS